MAITAKRTGVIALVLVTLLAGGCATTVPTAPTPPALLENPTPGYEVSLWSERDPLVIGQLLNLNLRSMADGLMSLYAINASGQTIRLMNNRRVRAGQTVAFPGPRSRVDFRLTPPPGTETYLLVVTQQPHRWLAPADIHRRGAITRLNLSPDQLLRRLDASLRQLNPYAWNTARIDLPLVY